MILEKLMKYRNKHQSKLTATGLTILCLLATPLKSSVANANHVVSARHVNAIQTKQARSIEAGVKMGRLTPREARELRKEQYEITSVEREMRKDGALNGQELEDLFEKLKNSQNQINKMLRNNISTHAAQDHR
jgi:hypothetical protein